MTKRNPFRTLITEDDDDQVVCPMRIGFWISFVSLVFLAVYAVVFKGQPFDPANYGMGVGGLLVGAGAAIFFNAKGGAPKPPPDGRGGP